jgi:tRNA-uridine 2-sulfurtransferase
LLIQQAQLSVFGSGRLGPHTRLRPLRPLLEFHLSHPRGLGVLPGWPHSGAAGGAACGDLIRIAVRVEGDRVVEAGFDAEGCGAARAAGSAVVELVEGGAFLDAARITIDDVADALGGLVPPKRHAAQLAADALHRALGAAARAGAPGLEHSARRTVVAMSGGVDSAAAAQLALDAGDEVVAVTLELWADPATDGERSCCSPQAVTGARDLAHGMGLPHVTLDLRERFRADVVEHFLDGYASGQTPNPCVRCNGQVRFDAMLDLTQALGAARLATGHYARIECDDRGPLVRTATDANKDQSYMLARLEPELLERLWFPLGGLTKHAVRALARGAGLPVADKPESQDLCFVAGLGGRAFLQRHGGPRLRRAGEIVDRDGRVLGRHDGHHNFTVGQRRGLRLSSEKALYVLDKDAETGRVTVGPREALQTTRVRLESARLHRGPEAVDAVKLRYRSGPIPCRVRDDEGKLELELEHSASAVAPGQLACLLRGECVVGEGTIA